MRQQRCTYCSEPATLLCDFKLGWAIGELQRERDGSTWHAIDSARPPHTCDMPMCRAHAENRGGMHVRFRGAHGRRGFFDSIDHCLEHAGQSDAGTPVITDDEASRLRRAVHALAQRRAMRERGVVPGQPLPPNQGELF
ncbi:hypothetical protein [Burkholderia anthina]|uniref:hypothetical protein n=1 Tax=Burkholderia anthina TaxID=179879 RepID=UPI001589B924|nr:hypothetical protein [Burkholderia anthina]